VSGINVKQTGLPAQPSGVLLATIGVGMSCTVTNIERQFEKFGTLFIESFSHTLTVKIPQEGNVYVKLQFET
jgi:hypothetical protein